MSLVSDRRYSGLHLRAYPSSNAADQSKKISKIAQVHPRMDTSRTNRSSQSDLFRLDMGLDDWRNKTQQIASGFTSRGDNED